MWRNLQIRRGREKAPKGTDAADVPVEDIAAVVERRQFAALPFRQQNHQLEIMLVSSRGTRRWVLPKGWPMKGLSPHKVAAQEALEEAGVIGRTKRKPVGTYHYLKRMPNGAALSCAVDVFPLRVEKQRKRWKERDQRLAYWCPADEAAALVDEPELSDILIDFADRVAAGDIGVLPNKMKVVGDTPR
jgi:8-oxo-dGTP pyrophosphatase MutT (NUDIX family)